MVRARQELAAGRSVIIFPEGQISSQPGQVLEPFKEAAFQLAIAAGVPIVPITMPLNHHFLPDVGGLRVRWARRCTCRECLKHPPEGGVEGACRR